MRSAIYLAIDIYRTRKFIKDINSDPLPKRAIREEKQSKFF